MIQKKSRRTIAASHGIATDQGYGSVVQPLYLSSNFVFPDAARHPHFDYSRTANPSRELLAETLAKLEGGAGAVVTSSGMAAINLVLDLLPIGAGVVAPHDCYGGTYRLLAARRDRGQLNVVFVDQTDEGALLSALVEQTKLVLVETPSNPVMRVTDLRRVIKMAGVVGAQVAVDNTFLSPALQQPITMGADFVIHSTTKYLNGHSDVVGGAVIAAKAEAAKRLADWANIIGAAGSPFDSYLTLRGIRSLFTRIERQQESAASIASFLTEQAGVTAVHYPGLPSHPGHGIASSQQAGFGAMLSFELEGGRDAVDRFLSAISLFTLAVSLGGVESLVAYPCMMTHSSIGADALRTAGITDGLLRLSIGLESEEDLIGDLEIGLAAAAGAAKP